MPAPPEYSDDAAVVFAVALLTPYVLVAGVWLANRVYKHYFGRPPYPTPIDAKQARVIEREKAEHAALKRLFTTGFTVNLVLVLLASYALVNLSASMSHQSEVAEYDPFQILQIDRGASDSEIKSSYRKLSLLYHPDKNPGNEEAERMFMAVSKAYETLTDAAARENWELYGNPDGRQSLAVSIGLPKVLLQQDTKTTVVLIYVFFLVIIIPALVFWCRRTEQKATLSQQSIPALFRLQSFGPQLKDYIEMISTLPDLFLIAVKLKIDPRDPVLAELEETLHINARSAFDPSKSLKGGPAFPVLIALTAYFNRYDRLPRALQIIQEEFIKLTDPICQHLLGLAGQPRPPFYQNEKGKQLPLNYDPSFALRNAIEFQTRTRQRLGVGQSSLLQIPNFTEEMASYCKVSNKGAGGAKGAASSGRIMTLKEYVRQDRAALKGLKDLSPQQHLEVMAFLDICPNLHVDAHVNVAPPHPDAAFNKLEDDDVSGSDSDSDTDKGESKTDTEDKKKIADESEAEAAKTAEVQSGFRERDVVTLTVIATHENLPAGVDELPPVYTPYQDKLQREEWFVFLVNENEQIVQIGQFPGPLKRTMKLEIKFQAPRMRKGKPYHFRVDVISGNYVDLSFSAPVMFEVVEPFPEEAMRPQVPAVPKQKRDGDSSDDSSDEDVGAGTGMASHGHSHGGVPCGGHGHGGGGDHGHSHGGGDHGHSHGGGAGGDDSDDDMPDLIPSVDENTAGLSAAQLRKRQKRLESKQKKGAGKAGAGAKAGEEGGEEEGEGSGKPHDE